MPLSVRHHLTSAHRTGVSPTATSIRNGITSNIPAGGTSPPRPVRYGLQRTAALILDSYTKDGGEQDRDHKWSDRLQGIAYDGDYQRGYLYTTRHGKREDPIQRYGLPLIPPDRSYVYKFPLAGWRQSFWEMPDSFDLHEFWKTHDSDPGNLHPGDPDVKDGTVYIPVQHGGRWTVVSFPTGTFPPPHDQVNVLELDGTDCTDINPWCCIHPWAPDAICTTEFGDDGKPLADRLLVFDLTTGQRRPEFEVPLDPPAHRVQGGFASDDGYLALACDTRFRNDEPPSPAVLSLPESIRKGMGLDGDYTLRAPVWFYDLTTGQRLGRLGIVAGSRGGVDPEELEGLTVRKRNLLDPDDELCVTHLNWDYGDDTVFLKRFRLPAVR